MADRSGCDLRLVLASADAFSDMAIFLGSFHVNTPASRERAWLRSVTSADHFLVDALTDVFLPVTCCAPSGKAIRGESELLGRSSSEFRHRAVSNRSPPGYPLLA